MAINHYDTDQNIEDIGLEKRIVHVLDKFELQERIDIMYVLSAYIHVLVSIIDDDQTKFYKIVNKLRNSLEKIDKKN